MQEPGGSTRHFALTRWVWSLTGQSVIAGTISGLAGVIAGHPFDTIKVRLQSQQHSSPLKYRNTLHCMLSILREERFRGFFKGLSSPLVGFTAVNTLLFGVYGFFESQLGQHDTKPTITQIFVAGCLSGFFNSFISSPIELAKIQLQNQIDSKRNFKNPSSYLWQTYQKNGIAGCYRGLLLTIMRETPSYGVYFATFEGIRLFWAKEGMLNGYQLLMAGGFSGIAAWMSTYPFDVVKTRIQAQPLLAPRLSQSLTGRRFSQQGILSHFKSIFKEEGLPGFFRGITATIIRAFPTNAVILSVYSLTMRSLDRANPLKDHQ